MENPLDHAILLAATTSLVFLPVFHPGAQSAISGILISSQQLLQNVVRNMVGGAFETRVVVQQLTHWLFELDLSGNLSTK